MSGTWITIPSADGGSFKAYMAVPEDGTGPGLLLLQEIFGINPHIREVADRYAEEGYVVLAPDLFWRVEPGIELGFSEAEFNQALGIYGKFDINKAVEDIGETLKALRARPECTGKVGAVGFCLGGKLAYLTAARTDVDAAISYYGVGIETNLDEADKIKCPLVIHNPGLDSYIPPEAVEKIRAAFKGRPEVEIFVYPDADHGFDNQYRPMWNRNASWNAKSRTLACLKKVMGPIYDLSAIWDDHITKEFVNRDVEGTMKTMVDHPYVNDVPTMTGGVGYGFLKRFYIENFVFQNPPDTRSIPVSRTVGADRLVDEMVMCFTHTQQMDWMLPGVPATGKYVEIPLVAVINFRGKKLYHEHIYWDQASVLVQVGLLKPDGLPVTGIEQAKKHLDETMPSNTLIPGWYDTQPAA